MPSSPPLAPPQDYIFVDFRTLEARRAAWCKGARPMTVSEARTLRDNISHVLDDHAYLPVLTDSGGFVSPTCSCGWHGIESGSVAALDQWEMHTGGVGR